MRCYIPLSIVLAFQVLIVAASFTAVIVVLSELQRVEFQDSLSKQLALQRINSLQSVATPLLQRKETFNYFVKQYLNGHLNDKAFAAPSDVPGATADLQRMMPFYNQFYGFTTADAMVRQVFVANQSLNTYPGYAVNGSRYKEGYHDPDNSKNTIWNIWTVDSQKMAVVQDEVGRACFGTYPINPATCPTISLYFSTGVSMGVPDQYNRTGGRRWGSPGMLSDPTVPGGLAHVYTYSINTNVMRKPYVIFAISFLLDNVKPLVVSSVSAPTSKSALFSKHEQLMLNRTAYFLIAGKFDFTDYDVTTFISSGQDYMKSAWHGGKTPDPILNKAFALAEHMHPGQTGSATFEFAEGGSKFVGSMGRLMDADSGMNWLLVEYTPRAEFYGASDRARLTGILIGVFGALLVLVTCIVIWLAVRQPLLQLRAGMGLAAEMRNDEVQHIDPVLSEISELGQAFRQMNGRLLAARPFLPQSLLQARGDTSQEEDEEVELVASKIESETNSETDKRNDMSSKYDSSATRTTYSSQHAKHTLSRKAVKGALLSNLQRELETRRVGVLAINVLGFHGAMPGGLQHGAVGLLRVHKALARIVEAAVGEERGIVDYFHGDRFVCGFNTARLCGNSARSGAEAAAKIAERFAADGELVQAFPHGLAMGLGCGKAVVGNHGTDTMQRLATLGRAYGKALRLQEVMGRRVLFGAGSIASPHPASRCLLMGRAVQDLETSNIHCQLLGGVPASVFMPASEAHGDPKPLQSMANALNLAIMRCKVNEVQNFSDTVYAHLGMVKAPVPLSSGSSTPTVLVACLVAKNSHPKAEDEWLYEMDKSRSENPYAETNVLLQKLWVEGSIAVSPPIQSRTNNIAPGDNDSAVNVWVNHVKDILRGASSADDAKLKLSYYTHSS